MNYQFLLNNIPVQVETAPVITETFDETLDSAQVVLKANDIEKPYAPMQEFKIIIDNATYLFYVVSDVVETFSYNPLRYKHTLTLTQNTRKLSKHTVRNSVFTQPIGLKKSGYYAVTNLWNGSSYIPLEDYNGNKNHWIEPISLGLKEKLYGKLRYKITIYKAVGYVDGDIVKGRLETVTNVADLGKSVSIAIHKDTTSMQLPLTDNIINKWVESDSITSFINGSNQFYFCLDDLSFATGTVTPQNPILRFILQVEYEVATYYYNCYDLLNTLRLREQNKTTYHQDKLPLFNLPKSGELYNLLTNTIPPNLTFTQETMFECVADIFKLFDATFTLDENNVLGIEYLNEYQEQAIKSFSSQKAAIGEEKYNNGLLNFYRDARTTKSFPSTKSFAGLRNNDVGVPDKGSYAFIVPQNIQYIDNLYLLCKDLQLGAQVIPQEIGGGIPSRGFKLENVNLPINITRYVLESSLWTLLNNSSIFPLNGDYAEQTQFNCLLYTAGSNKIEVSKLSSEWWGGTTAVIVNLANSAIKRFTGWRYNNTPELIDQDIDFDFDNFQLQWEKVKMRIDYTTTVNGVLKKQSLVNKYDGDIIVNQSSGAVALDKLGLNMDGLSLKLGEPTLTMRQALTDFNGRIKKGQYIIKDGEKWVANICRYTLFNDKIEGVIDFSKNFNALSSYIKINREKRLSAIDSHLTNKSEMIIESYIYYSIGNGADIVSLRDYGERTILTATNFIDMLSKLTTIDYVLVTSYVGSNQVARNVCMPNIVYNAGNTFCIECSFEHPISAGNQLKVENSGWWFTNKSYFSKTVPYTDNNGFIDYLTIDIMQSGGNSGFSENYPQLTNAEVAIDTRLGRDSLDIYKQSNEVFAFNYEFHFLPLESKKDTDFIGSKFLELLSNNANNVVNTTQFILYFSTETYDILDTQAKGNIVPAILSSTVKDVGFASLSWEILLPNPILYRSLCMADQYGNILFAKNFDEIKSTAVAENKTFGIGIITKNNRIIS